MNKKIKDYCPDTHCGVWIDRDSRQCVKSLTCKVSRTNSAIRVLCECLRCSFQQDHTLSERRQVKGRTKPFDELLKQHQEKMRKKGKSTKTATSASNTETREQPTEEDRYVMSFVFSLCCCCLLLLFMIEIVMIMHVCL